MGHECTNCKKVFNYSFDFDNHDCVNRLRNSDFHLKFNQCFTCKGFGPYDGKIYDEFNRGFCCKECYVESIATGVE